MPSGITKFTAVAIAFCVGLAALEAASALGAPVSQAIIVFMASATAVLTATVAIRHVAYVWRGPVIVSFRRAEAVLCDAREATIIRSAAQLRGTMGGAGHFHRSRLAFSAAAWGAACAQSLTVLRPERSAAAAVPLGLLLLFAGLSAALPARPFYYRETAGGCVVVFPAPLCRRLLDEAGAPPVLQPLHLDGRTGVGGVLGGPLELPPEANAGPTDGSDEASF